MLPNFLTFLIDFAHRTQVCAKIRDIFNLGRQLLDPLEQLLSFVRRVSSHKDLSMPDLG